MHGVCGLPKLQCRGIVVRELGLQKSRPGRLRLSIAAQEEITRMASSYLILDWKPRACYGNPAAARPLLQDFQTLPHLPARTVNLFASVSIRGFSERQPDLCFGIRTDRNAWLGPS